MTDYHVVVNYSVVFLCSARTKMLVHGVNFVLYILIVLKYHVAAG